MGKDGFNLNNYLKSFKKGNFIYLEGDPATGLFLMQSGSVQLRRKLNTQELIIGTCGPGDFFGLVPAIEKWVYTETAEVSQDSEIFILKPTDLEQLVINDPSIGFKVVNQLSNQLRELDIKLEKLSGK
jgi:CRP-like cAMP-binding protein